MLETMLNMRYSFANMIKGVRPNIFTLTQQILIFLINKNICAPTLLKKSVDMESFVKVLSSSTSNWNNKIDQNLREYFYKRLGSGG